MFAYSSQAVLPWQWRIAPPARKESSIQRQHHLPTMYAKNIIMLVSAWLLCSPLGSLGAVELQHAGETCLPSLQHKCSIKQPCRKICTQLGSRFTSLSLV